MSADIVVRGLTKSFARRGAPVLDALDLSVGAGRLACVLGPSGSGKSTLLGCVAGLVRPDAGTVHIGGVDVTGVPAHRRPVTLVMQQPQLFGHFSVAENVAFGLRVRGASASERSARAEALLDLVGLGGTGGRRVAGLSGGERQRVALARALAVEPAVLLLDEPFASLDPPVRRELQDLLRLLQRARDVTVVLVTHDREEALALADEISVIDRGAVGGHGPPAELYERPPTVAVARLLGIATLLAGDAFGRTGMVAIRPEHVRVGPNDAAGIAARVVAHRYTGAVTEVRCDTALGTIVASVASALAPGLGEEVRLVLPAEHLIELPR